MATQNVDTLIIGAGQAGLSTAWHLQRRGRECLVVDGISRLGDNWRVHYDSLKLFTPAQACALPGAPFPGSGYPTKDDMADYLEQYAMRFDLPVRLNTRIDSVERVGEAFVASHEGGTITADNIVVASGPYGRVPNLPAIAEQIDPGIRQLHSGDYKNPGQLRPGPVLVVGTSHSGADIAYELAASFPTTLAGREVGQMPFRLETTGARVFPLLKFAFKHVLTRRTPMGRAMRAKFQAHHGAPGLRIQRQDLAGRGVRRVYERVENVVGGKPALADGTVLDVANIVWCTGFRHDYSWLHLPVFDDHGWPIEYRGVVDDQPGLYFCGLFFQFSFASSMLPGIGRDAEFVARRIARRPTAVPA